MSIFQAVIVGVVQGLAEFLPISSSGHIVLTQFLLGIRQQGDTFEPDLGFEVVLHMGTLLSVLIFFRRRLWDLCVSLVCPQMKEQRRSILLLVLATLPAVIAVKLFKDTFESAYESPVLVSALLIVTGGLLFVPKLVVQKAQDLGWKHAWIMGCAQAMAILPGISRSGSTIAAGITAGGKPQKVAEFSFLMSIPAILGGLVLTLKDRVEEASQRGLDLWEACRWACLSCFTPEFIAGALAAGAVGLLAIYFVMGVVRRGKLDYFSYYCFAAGISGIIYFSL